MDLAKALTYGALGVGILIVVGAVVSVVTTLLGLAWTVVSSAVSLAILLGVLYVAYVVGSFLFGGSGDADRDAVGRTASSRAGERSPTSRTGESSESDADPEERLRERYVAGEIDEAEFERRLEESMSTDVTGSSDRSGDVDVERELDRLREE